MEINNRNTAGWNSYQKISSKDFQWIRFAEQITLRLYHDNVT